MQKKQSSSSSNEYWAYPSLDKVTETALYYGFTPIIVPDPEKGDYDIANSITEHTLEKHIPLDIAPVVSIIRHHFQKPPAQVPFMNLRQSPSKKDRKFAEYYLDCIGSTRSVVDATVIHTAYMLALEEGYQEVTVEINSIGDKDSMNRFSRELNTYFRKNITDLHPDCRQALKKSPYAALVCAHEKCIEIAKNAPRPLSFLSEISRIHFKEVLEFLEMSQLPYSINNNLIANPEFVAHTIFSIKGKEEDKKEAVEIAYGMRFAGIAKKIGLKKDVPGMSAVIKIKVVPQKNPKRIPKPQLYLIQMGSEAKLRSLKVIEVLRKTKVPVYHSLTKDKFAAQLQSAENLKVPYILIIGQKESIENTVLIRNMSNRSQETVKVPILGDYIKKILS